MENATKALLMAAVILISVIILSLGVYLFMYFSDYAKGVNDDIRDNQIQQFNSQFLSYEGKELTVYDVITLANLAKDYNKANEFYDKTSSGYINVDAMVINSSIGAVPPPEGEVKGGIILLKLIMYIFHEFFFLIIQCFLYFHLKLV